MKNIGPEAYLEAATWMTTSLYEVWTNQVAVSGQEFSIMLPEGICSAEIFVMTPDMARRVKKIIQEDIEGDDNYIVDNPVD